MITLDNTSLEYFSFGDNPDDEFYLLINTKLNPDPIDIERLKRISPTSFEHVLNDMGCIMMLDGHEVNELVRRGDADRENLHASLFEVAKREGIL